MAAAMSVADDCHPMVHPELVAMTILDAMVLCRQDGAFLLSHAAVERECAVSWWAFDWVFC